MHTAGTAASSKDWIDNVPRPLKRSRNKQSDASLAEDSGDGDDEADGDSNGTKKRRLQPMSMKKVSAKAKPQNKSTAKTQPKKKLSSKRGISVSFGNINR